MTGTWSQESTAGIAFAVMAQVRSGIFVGGEARYLRKYDGLGWMRSRAGLFHRADDHCQISEKPGSRWRGARKRPPGYGIVSRCARTSSISNGARRGSCSA